jgi:hypothetical protein
VVVKLQNTSFSEGRGRRMTVQGQAKLVTLYLKNKKITNERAGNVAQVVERLLACVRPWENSPVPECVSLIYCTLISGSAIISFRIMFQSFKNKP